MFMAKDCLLVIDDFHPAGDERQRQQMAAVAARLLRSVGNGQARARMTADTRLRRGYPPRCIALVTAERLPEGYSNAARALPVPLGPGDLSRAALERALADRPRYALAMAGYARWLGGQFDTLGPRLAQRFAEPRAAADARPGIRREPR